MTASADQFVHLWNFNQDDSLKCGTNVGTLKQGYW